MCNKENLGSETRPKMGGGSHPGHLVGRRIRYDKIYEWHSSPRLSKAIRKII